VATAHVTDLYMHPVKGLSPRALTSARVEPERGIPGDRAFALLFADVEADRSTRAVPFLKKPSFAVQADWPGLAALRCDVDPDSGRFAVRDGTRTLLSANLHDDRAAIDAFFTQYLTTLAPTRAARHPQAAPVTLIGEMSAATRYPDRIKHDVSILNRASLRAVAEKVGCDLDPRRFRGNIVVDGLDPWAELALVGRQIRCGEAVLVVDAPIIRCSNVDVDPDTGDASVQVLRTVGTSPGKGCFGMVARVVAPGRIAVGDAASVID
jgi:uncharacterized protein YcbX